MISCPAGGRDCVLTVASTTAETVAYERTGGVPIVAPVLIELNLRVRHGIADDTIDDDQGVRIEAGSAHHGEHGISVACPAGGSPCYVDFTDDEGWYHRRGTEPTVLIHELVWAANDQKGRALSVFARDQEDYLSGQNPVGSRLYEIYSRSGPYWQRRYV